MNLCLEGGPVKIKKKKKKGIVHGVTSHPTVERVNTMRCTMRNIIEDQTKAEWNA